MHCRAPRCVRAAAEHAAQRVRPLQIEAMQRVEEYKRRMRQSLTKALESHMNIDVRITVAAPTILVPHQRGGRSLLVAQMGELKITSQIAHDGAELELYDKYALQMSGMTLMAFKQVGSPRGLGWRVSGAE